MEVGTLFQHLAQPARTCCNPVKDWNTQHTHPFLLVPCAPDLGDDVLYYTVFLVAGAAFCSVVL